jgi:hypothetical protein
LCGLSFKVARRLPKQRTARTAPLAVPQLCSFWLSGGFHGYALLESLIQVRHDAIVVTALDD